MVVWGSRHQPCEEVLLNTMISHGHVSFRGVRACAQIYEPYTSQKISCSEILFVFVVKHPSSDAFLFISNTSPPRISGNSTMEHQNTSPSHGFPHPSFVTSLLFLETDILLISSTQTSWDPSDSQHQDPWRFYIFGRELKSKPHLWHPGTSASQQQHLHFPFQFNIINPWNSMLWSSKNIILVGHNPIDFLLVKHREVQYHLAPNPTCSFLERHRQRRRHGPQQRHSDNNLGQVIDEKLGTFFVRWKWKKTRRLGRLLFFPRGFWRNFSVVNKKIWRNTGKRWSGKTMGKTVKPMKTELNWRRLDYMKLWGKMLYLLYDKVIHNGWVFRIILTRWTQKNHINGTKLKIEHDIELMGENTKLNRKLPQFQRNPQNQNQVISHPETLKSWTRKRMTRPPFWIRYLF